MNTFTKFLFSLTIPFIFLTLALVVYYNFEQIPYLALNTVNFFSFIILLITLLISYRFNRSKVFFATLIIAISQITLLSLYPYNPYNFSYENIIYFFISALIPANILILSLFNFSGIKTLGGKLFFIFITSQCFLVWVVISEQLIPFSMMNTNSFSLKLSSITPIPQASLIVFLIALIILSFKQLILKASLLTSSFIGILLASAMVLHLKANITAIPIFFSGAGLILVSVVIHEAYKMAYLDELTELPSRRALKEDLDKESGTYCIAILDIDHFKQVNDTHGHDVGDEVLKFIASKLKKVGGKGKGFRYGGEEFIIFFPNNKLNDTLPHLEELREEISQHPFIIREKSRPKKKPTKISKKRSNKKSISISVSIGVAEKNSKNKTSEQVIKAADKALYQAKNMGRNCVCK